MANNNTGDDDEYVEGDTEDDGNDVGHEPGDSLPEHSTSMSDAEILSLLAELRSTSTEDEPFRQYADVIERLCTNRDFSDDPISQTYVTRLYTNPRTTMQIMENLVLTWAALICKKRTSVYGVPLDDTVEATMAADIATKFVEYLETEESTADKWHQSAIWAAQHGTGMMRINYNPVNNKVEWEPVNIFNVFLHNSPHANGVKWALIRTFIDQYDARDLMKNLPNRDTDSLPGTTQYTDAYGVSRYGVEKWEIWYKPGSRYKDGVYACVIAGEVVEEMKYPYVFDEKDGSTKKAILPVVWWTCRKTRESTLGFSWTRDVAPQQMSLNALLSKQMSDALRSRQLMKLPSSLKQMPELIDEESAFIYFDPADTAGAAMIGWISPAPLDPNVMAQVRSVIENMYTSAGISQSTTGDASASQSGKALAYQAELDSDKHADSWKNYERAQKAAWELTLKLAQKYYTEEQKFDIGGGVPLTFTGADLAGVTVRLEPRTEDESSRAQKTLNTQTQIANGFASPDALLALPTTQTSGMKGLADQLVTDFLDNKDVSITPETIPPAVMVQAIDERIWKAMTTKDNSTLEALQVFKAEYLKSIQSAQEPDAGAAQAPPPGPGPLPEQTSEESLASEPLPEVLA